MERFTIKAREFVPHVDFNPTNGKLLIEGESYHEYTQEFFEPLFDWVANFLKDKPEQIQLDFKMRYFNTASSKCFYEIIERLQEYHEEEGHEVAINWYYEDGDEDMLEVAEDYVEDSGFPINMVPI